MRVRETIILAACVILSVTACEKLPIDESHIILNKAVIEQFNPNPALKNAIAIGEVTSSAQVQDLRFDVSTDSYRRVLIRALNTQGYRAKVAEKARYVLTAQLQDLSLSGGFDTEAHSQISYQLVDRHVSAIVWSETIILPYVERYQFGADGVQKTQSAIEGALRENVTHMVRLLAELTLSK